MYNSKKEIVTKSIGIGFDGLWETSIDFWQDCYNIQWYLAGFLVVYLELIKLCELFERILVKCSCEYSIFKTVRRSLYVSVLKNSLK